MIPDNLLGRAMNGTQLIPEPALNVVFSVCHMSCGAFYLTGII
jgi:hypothetical protein